MFLLLIISAEKEDKQQKNQEFEKYGRNKGVDIFDVG